MVCPMWCLYRSCSSDYDTFRRFFPGIDETKLFPQDVMHAEGDGILGEEAYQCFHVLIKVRKYFTLHRANFIIKCAPSELWSDGIPVRPIHSSILDGVKVAQAKRMRWTAAETHKFALASVQLFDHLVPPQEPVWQCWKLHVSYLQLVLQHSLTSQDIANMDKLIFEHQTMYQQVCVCVCEHAIHCPRRQLFHLSVSVCLCGACVLL